MINPILLEILESFETERLHIRVLQAGDGPALGGLRDTVVFRLTARDWLARGGAAS